MEQQPCEELYCQVKFVRVNCGTATVRRTTHFFFISNSIFHFSLELLRTFSEMRLKVANELLTVINFILLTIDPMALKYNVVLILHKHAYYLCIFIIHYDLFTEVSMNRRF